MKNQRFYLTYLSFFIAFMSHSQWNWQNPNPQGNSLNDVFFVNQDTGWAVGELGTIIMTTDGAESFKLLESSVFVNLNAVEFIDSQLGFIAGNNGTILGTNNGGIGWYSINTGITADLKDVFVIVPDLIWVAGEKGTILFSDDAGGTWDALYDDTTVSINSIFFINASNGWAVGGNDTSGSVVLKTFDGGNTWAEVTGGILPPFKVVQFMNDSIGWSIGGQEVVKSIDGGNTWEGQFGYTGPPPPPPNSPGYFDLFFSCPENGWFITGVQGQPYYISMINHTPNGGDTLEVQDGFTDMRLNDMYFIDNEHGCVVGSNGGIVKTSDGGLEWTIVTGEQPFSPPLYDVFFTSETNGFAVGGAIEIPMSSHRILRTTNGGSQWLEMESTEHNVFNAVYFTDSLTGWIAGGGNYADQSIVIIHTADGGETWQTQLKKPCWAENQLLDICFTDPLHGWAVGGVRCHPPIFPLFYQTVNGGETWEDISFLAQKNLFAISFPDSNHGWVVGHETILRTDNGGQTWTKQRYGTHCWRDVFFFDQFHGWIIGDSIDSVSSCGIADVVMRTTDGGFTWEKKFIDMYLKKIWFTSINTGYISVGNGIMLYTSDGGVTWKEQYIQASATLHGLFFLDQNMGWVVGDHCSILHTDCGGIVDVPKIEPSFSTFHVKIYPNPTRGIFNLQFTIYNLQSVSLRIYDLYGREVAVVLDREMPAGEHVVRYDVSDLPEGVYFVELRAEGEGRRVVSKLVVQ